MLALSHKTLTMPAANHTLFYQYDEYGPVKVIDDGNHRRLSFGADDFQSCMVKEAPLQLQFDYLRAMALATLLQSSTHPNATSPNKVLLLGLGAGSLARFLHAYFPAMQVSVVELRQLVITVASRFFELPDSPRLEVIQDNATDFLAYDNNHYAIVMSDIYTEEGVDHAQLSVGYINACKARLKPNGWLVLNCWYEHKGRAPLAQALRQAFSQLYCCHTQSGNWVIFASNASKPIDTKALINEAKNLSTQAGFSLHAIARKLQKF